MKLWLRTAAFIMLCISPFALISFVYFYQQRDSQETLIKLFNDNYSLFSGAADYLDTEPGTIYIFHPNNKTLRIWINDDEIKSDINQFENPQILDLLRRYNLYSINESEDQIEFIKVAGVMERGILYMKDNKNPHEILK